jgi:molybdenum cofactor cytidylyltransferase
VVTGEDVSARLEAIVLAAGAGTRFGGGKLTAPWRGGVLLEGALAAAFAAPARSVTVVTGADARVAAAAADFAARRAAPSRLRLVHAADHALGLSASLKAGLQALPPDAGGVFVFLGDMPRVPAATLPLLAAAVSKGALAAAPAFEGRRGHPVLFARGLFEPLLALDGDEGARSILSRLGARLIEVPCPDPGILLDIDHPTDLDGA